jgi:CHAT domain-containing protein/tetratricopeptide (TPR) repeat protein
MLNIGFSHQVSGAPQQALEYRQKALALSESLRNRALVAQTLLNLGNLYRTHSYYAEALDYFQRELSLREGMRDRRAAAATLNNIGAVKRLQGNYAEALEYHRRALKLSEESGHRSAMANARAAAGDVLRLQGNSAAALESFRDSLKLNEALRDKRGIANALHRTGIVYYHQGNFELALEHFQRALKLREELGEKPVIADSLNTIGLVHFEWKDYPAATKYISKSLSLQEQVGSRRGAAIALTNLAGIEREQKNYPRAVEFLQRSLKLSEAIGDRELLAGGLSDMAELRRLQGKPSEALVLAERATSLAKEIGKLDSIRDARLTAAKIYRDLDRDSEARQAFDEAVREVESLRSNIAGQEARASYFARVQETYELYTDLLMKLHKRRPSEALDAAALQLSERARARSLLEALAESGADIRQGADPALLASERTLQQRLNAAAQRQTALLGGQHTAEQLAQVKKEIVALNAELQDVRTQVRQKSPRYAALTQPVPLDLKQMQQLLDEDTLLLEYALGDARSYLWALTRTEFKSFELPGRAEIEKTAKSVYGWLTVRNGAARGSFGEKAKPAPDPTQYLAEAARLSRMVLGPATQMLGAKRLVVVADGALQYVPFAALPHPTAGRGGQASQPLVVSHEIVTLPSASVLSVLRRDFASRPPASKAVAVLADPVFDISDERLAAASTGQTRGQPTHTPTGGNAVSQPAASRADLERALKLGRVDGAGPGQRSGFSIPRLPFTRREAAAILAAAPGEAGFQALDFRASRETATSAELAQYRVVHFATHGLLNGEHPELSGVVLSLVDERGQPQDGFLRLHEIYNLNLPAELVVLSACQTALGKEVRGEGLVGLTRGFMYAGSPRVVASLWQVDDVATAELMKNFYRGMLTEKLRPAAALRAAQVEMWKQRRWRAPYYWAAFQLQGEWR